MRAGLVRSLGIAGSTALAARGVRLSRFFYDRLHAGVATDRPETCETSIGGPEIPPQAIVLAECSPIWKSEYRDWLCGVDADHSLPLSCKHLDPPVALLTSQHSEVNDSPASSWDR